MVRLHIAAGHDSEMKQWIKNFSSRYVVMSGLRPNFVYSEMNKKGDIGLRSVVLANTVFKAFGKCDCYTKIIPQAIFCSSESSITAFLRGYFSGDGWICTHHGQSVVACGSVSTKLLDGVSTLLDLIRNKTLY